MMSQSEIKLTDDELNYCFVLVIKAIKSIILVLRTTDYTSFMLLAGINRDEKTEIMFCNFKWTILSDIDKYSFQAVISVEDT
jgi:hypothetical protein